MAYSRIVLTIAGVCIALGGLYDILTPRLPRNLVESCAGREDSCRAVRELLRALGGCLIAIGGAVIILANSAACGPNAFTVALILTLVLPSEGINAVGMYRVRSPFLVPLLFILLTLIGSALLLLGSGPA